MGDVTPSTPVSGSQGVSSLFLREEELRAGMEELFHVWRELSAAGDMILAAQGLGRAHQRALYFVGSHPGLVVSDLMMHLGITKQSLSRVLRRLVDDGLVEQTTGRHDRRQRQLRLTPEGYALEERLTGAQIDLLARAYRRAGAHAVLGFRHVLSGVTGAPSPQR
ncbi:MAG: MarR family transcriptional regulator [Rhodospirillaceae bacterium]|nr:MarR family transcriptional regulator [Rhodospirillaceae bacterium]